MAAKLGSTVGLLGVAIGLAACGGASADDPSTAGTPHAKEVTAADQPSQPATAAAPAGKAGIRIKTRQSGYGTILVTGAGRTIYLFDKEERPKSECYGDCAEAWPPVLTRGAPVAGSGTRPNLLGTTIRNGKRQVTYAGHPLYLYAPEGPGEILCQDVFEYGGLWLIVRPSGKPVR